MYSEIISNKRKTIFFLLIFILLISLVSYVIGELSGFYNPYFIVFIGLTFSVITCFVSYYHSDKIILRMAGAKPVDREKDAYIYNTVEGLSMSAGMPMPKVYIIENSIPNAFATGRNPENGVIAVTRGLLNIMNREELEGVIAHEMAHIKNYDILYATIVAVMAGVLVHVSRIALRSMFYGGMGGNNRKRNNSENKSGNPIFMVLGIILIIISPILAKILQFAISRNREYLADATAASLIGYPLGLASALEKLSMNNNTKLAKENNFDNEAITALCIVNPLKSNSLENAFSTHPPINKRVKRLKDM